MFRKNKCLFFGVLLFILTTIEGLNTADIPIYPRHKSNVHKRKGKIAIAAIFRDEAPYLKEWIEYHSLIGVSHFYLYNNLSQDNYEEVLSPYVKTGVVELFDVPFDSYAYDDGAKTHNFVQVCCYNHAIDLSKGFNQWLAVIDVDEFVCPVADSSLSKALDRYAYAGGLVVYWQKYGTSNVWELKPGELLIEKLLYKEPLGTTALFKSIVRPDSAVCLDPHLCITAAGRFVAPNHQGFSHTPNFSVLPIDILRINHYTYRTESYFYHFKKERRERWGDRPDAALIKARLEECNAVYDPIMLRFVEKLRKRI